MDKDKLLLARISDKIKQYKKYGEATYTAFLDPAEQNEIATILRDIPHAFFGGYPDAERKILMIGISDWGLSPTGLFFLFGTDTTNSVESLPIKAIMVTANAPLSHRSVLGSILGLGITREKVGDIIVSGETCDVIVQRDIADFVLNNLTYVGKEKVKVQKIELNDLMLPEKIVKEIDITVASLRLDAVISRAIGLSREKSSSLIESERVNVNHKLVTSIKKAVCEGDLISVRGYGRIEIAQIMGESKSGRIKMRINKM